MTTHDASTAVDSTYGSWIADDYYQFYYRKNICRDERITLKCLVDYLGATPRRFERALDYGCGPTLHNAIAVSPYVEALDMADWSRDNLRTVRTWSHGEPGANDWNLFTRYILSAEGRKLVQAPDVLQREQRARWVIGKLFGTDARHRYPLGQGYTEHYDLLITGYCLDCISGSRVVWRQCMQNVLSTLAPGGTLFLNALWRCSAYQVQSHWFPGSDVDVDDLHASLIDNGFERRTLDIQAFAYPDQRSHGYPGILIALGRKKVRARGRAIWRAPALANYARFAAVA
jgi:hypothetical protein